MAEESKPALLEGIQRHIQEQFDARRNILSFERYFQLVTEHPARYLRGAYQYVTDMIDYYGRRDTKTPGAGGYAVFDQPFAEGKGAVWGQKETELEIYRRLQSFARGGRADKLILLHGPNGSAKSSLVRALIKGIEAYSQTDAGAVYRFAWIFPEERSLHDKIGFSKEERPAADVRESYAYLPESRIAARLLCPLHDNPLFLIPADQRRRLATDWQERDAELKARGLSEAVAEGDLSPMNRQIFDALLLAYGGDYARVLQHVQVERYYFSERYKTGAVTIEPQMSVDAHVQQLTADRSLSALPAVLQTLAIFEPGGHLVQANHGIVEFSDLLKRPVEAFKYLLSACEKGTINLNVAVVYLDLVMLGSTNDRYLEAFKQAADWNSFKGRMELVRVPYLRDYVAERKIYDSQLNLEAAGRPVTPHLTELAALWAVLTRLRRPDPERYVEQLKPVIARLNPLEKALFYSHGETPEWLTLTQARELVAARESLGREFEDGPDYEGALGASPREVKMILMNAVQAESLGCISAKAVIDEIRRLLRDRSVYEWLQVEPEGDYFDQERLLAFVERHYIDKVDGELKVAMEMVEEAQYQALMERYVAQASAWIQKKRVVDPVSGEERPVDPNFLREIEQIIAPAETAETYRREVVSRVAAFALENPDAKVDYPKIFAKELRKIEAHYFSRQQTRIKRLKENLLRFLSGREKELPTEAVREVRGCLERMQTRFGYHPDCTREVVALLMRTKYADEPGYTI